MPSCEACFQKAENLALDHLGPVGKRDRAPLMVHVGSSSGGEVYVCPVCGDTVVKPKKGESDAETPDSRAPGGSSI